MPITNTSVVTVNRFSCFYSSSSEAIGRKRTKKKEEEEGFCLFRWSRCFWNGRGYEEAQVNRKNGKIEEVWVSESNNDTNQWKIGNLSGWKLQIWRVFLLFAWFSKENKLEKIGNENRKSLLKNASAASGTWDSEK